MIDLPHNDRRAFLRFAFAAGVGSLLNQKAIAQAAQSGASPTCHMTLAKFRPLDFMPAEDIAANRLQYTEYFRTKNELPIAIEAAKGKSDPVSMRLQNYGQMIELAKQLHDDPLTQACAVHAYIFNAIRQVDRSLPNPKDITKMEKFIFPAVKAIGEAEGMCGEIGLAEVQADEMIGPKGYTSWAVGAMYESFGHLVRVVQLHDTGQKIVFDVRNNIVEDADKYFNSFTHGIRPCDVLDADGNVVALYGKKSKDIVLNPRPVEFVLKSESASILYNACLDLGKETGRKHPHLGLPVGKFIPGSVLAPG